MQSEIYLGYGCRSMQLGPDGKIYINATDVATPDADSIHVINYPSEPGVNCGFQKNILALEGNSISNRFFPQFLQKYILHETHQDQCEGDTVFFTSTIWPEADSIHWDFGDPASGASNYSLIADPAHLYTSPGIYSVTLFVLYIDKRTDTLTKTVQVYAYPNPDLGPDTIICLGDSATFDADACSACTYQWTDISTGLPVGTGQTLTVGQTGIFTVTVTSGGICQGSDTVQLTVTLPPAITNNPLSKSICSGESTAIPLTSNVPGTDFSWTTIGSSPLVTGFSPGSGDTIDQALTNSGSIPETVTYWITPAIGNCVGDSVQYVVTVIPGDSVMISISSSADSVCAGTQITFSATSTGGGTTPAFQWKVNGINAGTNSPNYIYLPINGDIVTCTVTSNETCITGNPATSNPITMTVGQQPDVLFNACFDTIITITAKPFKLKGGIPLEGTYSGPGVNQITRYFNPAMAGVGLKTISYSYTNLFNCSNNATRTISVINPTPFTCGDSLTDIRDNKKYPTIQIASQCWLAVNLNHGQQIGGSSAQRDNCLVEKYCYNDLSANCNQYGALYQWDELMRYEDSEEIQGLCPPGWHVPSESDWNQLFTVYQGNAFAGSPLLYTGYSGFNVLLAGVEFFNQRHRFADFASIMWSSTSHGPYKAWSHGMNEYNYSVSYYPSYRSNAFPVRCVLD